MSGEEIALILLTGAFIGIAAFMLGDKAGFIRGRRVGWYERSRILTVDPRHPIFFEPDKHQPAKAHIRLLKDGTNGS